MSDARLGDGTAQCEMCPDECELTSVPVDGSIIKVCRTCRAMLEEDGRIEAIA